MLQKIGSKKYTPKPTQTRAGSDELISMTVQQLYHHGTVAVPSWFFIFFSMLLCQNFTASKPQTMENEKKLQAKELFFQTMLNKSQIADTVGVPRRTLHYWIKRDNWDRLKTSAEHMPSIMVENVYHILGNYMRNILSNDNFDEPFTRDQAEVMHLLTNTIRKLKNRSSLNDSMEMLALFQDGLRREDPALADALVPYVERYIANRARIYQHHIIPSDFNSECRIKIKPSNAKENRLDFFDMSLWSSEDGRVPPQWGPDPIATAEDMKPAIAVTGDHADTFPWSTPQQPSAGDTGEALSNK